VFSTVTVWNQLYPIVDLSSPPTCHTRHRGTPFGGWGCVLYWAYVGPVMRASPSTCRVLSMDWQVRGLGLSCHCLWYARRGVCLCPCVTTPRGFTSLAEYSFSGFIPTNKQTNKKTCKWVSRRHISSHETNKTAAGVPSSQALPGFLITAPRLCGVPDVIGALALVFWFLVCYTATQLATQLPQWRIQVVRSNKVARKRLTESNGTPAIDLGHMDVVLQ